eukprot:c47083_g1_i1.p1 GENE.c47083_g1_i1~~c47083_g1_i1.p1  ORF type:complete len:295 (+),score=74.33 c47083_g1_i1:33-887(+)
MALLQVVARRVGMRATAYLPAARAYAALPQLSRKEQNDVLKVAIETHGKIVSDLGITQDEETATAMKGLNAFLLGDVESGKLPDPVAYVAPNFGNATGRELLGKVLERARAVDWVGMSEGLDAKGREEIARFRTVCATMEKEMARAHQNYTTTIDWAAWKEKLDPALVGRVEAIVKNLKVPSFESLRAGAAVNVASLDAQMEEINKAATAVLKDTEVRFGELTAEREALREQARRAVLGTSTFDELKESPIMAKAIEDARDNHQWNAPTSWAQAEEAAKVFQKK